MRSMKKILIWIVSIIIIVAVVDIVFGMGMSYYTRTHKLNGDYRAIDHLIRDSVDELVVLGSSVALNSIDTKKISDSLNIKAYNGGSNGQTFPFYLTLMEIIADKPGLKTVILGMKEASLCDEGLGNRYNLLVPYYDCGHGAIDSRMESKSALDKLLLKSSLYRYNSIWFRILLYMFMDPGLVEECGFVAKDIPRYYPHKIRVDDTNDIVTDERRQEFEEFVSLCKNKNIRLIVCVPPRYEAAGDMNSGERYLRQRALSNDFELWFDAKDTPISSDSTLFYDNTHLNYLGADKYTDIVLSRLKNEIQR